jgi:hypothetical protein
VATSVRDACSAGASAKTVAASRETTAANGLHPRHARACQRLHDGEPAPGQHDAQRGAQARDQQRLRHHQARDRDARGSDGEPDQQLAGAPVPAGQQQQRDVGAGDQQHQAHRGQEEQQRAPGALHHVVLERHDRHAQVGGRVHRLLGADLGGDAAHLVLHGGERGAGADAPQRGVAGVVPRGEPRLVDLQRPPHLGVLEPVGLSRQQQVEVGRQHSDDLVRHAAQLHLAPDHARVAAETPNPHAVAEQHHRRSVRDVLLGPDLPAQLRLHAEEREEIGRHRAQVHRLRVVRAAQDLLPPGGQRDLLEQPAALAVVAHVERVDRRQVLGALAELVPEDGEPFGRAVGERPQQDAVHDAEQRGRRAHAQPAGEDRGRQEAGAARQGAHGEAQVVEHGGRLLATVGAGPRRRGPNRLRL